MRPAKRITCRGRFAMKENTLLDKALSLLSHPISLAALGLYAVNIFMLQRLSPNWLTGKLGDFAWVFVAPFALTALLAWLLPLRYNRHAFTFAVVGIVLIFGLTKTIPIISGLENLTGHPISFVQDASDLSALMVVPAILWLWRRPRVNVINKYPTGMIAIAFLALLTLADMAAPNFGITSIEFTDKAIIACNGYYGSLQSNDGGQTWQSAQSGCKEVVTSSKYGEVVQDPTDEKIQYQFGPGTIEHSADGGETWQIDYQWMAPSEAAQMYYRVSNGVYTVGDLPPISAALQPQTGDIFFAMGHEGILKRTAGIESDYTWIAVGNYKKMDYRKSELLFGLLYGEWMLALMAGGVGVTLIDRKLNPGKLKTTALILGVIGMIVFALILPPATTLASPYIGQFISMGLMILLLLILSLTINALVNAGTKSKSLLIACIIGFVTVTILSFVPYALWVYNVIPLYKGASLVAVTVSVLGIVGLQFVVQIWMPVDTIKP